MTHHKFCAEYFFVKQLVHSEETTENCSLGYTISCSLGRFSETPAENLLKVSESEPGVRIELGSFFRAPGSIFTQNNVGITPELFDELPSKIAEKAFKLFFEPFYGVFWTTRRAGGSRGHSRSLNHDLSQNWPKIIFQAAGFLPTQNLSITCERLFVRATQPPHSVSHRILLKGTYFIENFENVENLRKSVNYKSEVFLAKFKTFSIFSETTNGVFLKVLKSKYFDKTELVPFSGRF